MSKVHYMRKEVRCMPYLQHYTLDHLRDICKASSIDVSSCTKKEEVLDVITKFDTILEPVANLDISRVSESYTDVKHLENVQPLDESKHDISAWISMVERQLRRQDFAIADWAAECEPFLTGTALRAFDHLSDSSKDDWVCVKECILKAYNITQDGFRHKFRNLRKGGKESFFELGNQLTQCFHKWVQTPDRLINDKDFLRICDLLIVEQFISSIGDENLRRKLTEAEPKTLSNITTKADQYVNSKLSSYQLVSSTQYDRNKSNGSNSSRRHDQSRSDPQSKPRSIPVCYKCGEAGHKSPECKSPISKSPSKSSSNSTSSSSQTFTSSATAQQQKKSQKKAESINKVSSTSFNNDGHFVHVLINQQPMLAYIDSGSSESIITPTTAELLGLEILNEYSETLVAANNTPLQIFGKSELTDFRMGDTDVKVSFLVANINRPILLGRDILVDMLSVTLNFSKLSYCIGEDDKLYPLIVNMPILISRNDNYIPVDDNTQDKVETQKLVRSGDNTVLSDSMISSDITVLSDSISTRSDINDVYDHPLIVDSDDMPYAVPLYSDLSTTTVRPIDGPCTPIRQESSSSVDLITSRDNREFVFNSDTSVNTRSVYDGKLCTESCTAGSISPVSGESHHTNWYDILVSEVTVPQIDTCHISSVSDESHISLISPLGETSITTPVINSISKVECDNPDIGIPDIRDISNIDDHDINSISEVESDIPGINSITVDPEFSEYLGDVKSLIAEFPDVFNDKPGFCDLIMHRINLVEGAKPFKIPPYRVSPAKRASIVSQVEDLLKYGIITQISSEFSSSPVLLPKKDGTWRLVVDYRQLNKITVPDHYPLPTAESILSQLNGSECYSTFDLVKAFWQLALHPDDWHKTAFAVAGMGLFCFKTLSFGLRNAANMFQRTMDAVMIRTTGVFTNHFIDDILVNSRTPSDHLSHIKSTLQALRDAGLTVNLKKCDFLRSQVKFLGYVLSSDGIHINPEKYEAVARFPRPSDVKSLMRFLGLIAWCSKFIPNCSTLCDSLHHLKRKDVKWEWSDQCEDSFSQLKLALCESVALALPNFDYPFEIYCDASNVGLGAALTQFINGISRVVCFASRSLTSAERNYSTTSKEILSIVWSLELWHDYLLPYFQTIVYSDHQAISWLQSSKISQKNQRQVRWLLRLQPFNFIVKYRAGKNMIAPDCLSRAPLISTSSRISSVELAPDYDKNECYARNCNYLTIPISDDITYDWVACDKCSHWFHIDCVGLSKQQSIDLPFWYCEECKSDGIIDSQDVDLSTLKPTYYSIPSKDIFESEQSQDSELSPMYYYLMDNSKFCQNRSADDIKRIKALSKLYTIKDGILLKNGKIVVPQSLIKAVISNYHSRPTSGHLGVRKTLWKISQVYQWKGMRNHVRDFVKTCPACQFCKPSYRKPIGLMKTIVSSHVNEILSADFMGPFPRTVQGFQHLLVLEDHYSKFIFLFPVVHANSYVLKYIINHVLCTFGAVERLLSDNGPQFIAHRFLTLLRDWGVVQNLCIPYHPQANPVERVNRNLKSMLSCFHSSEHTHWSDYLCEFQFALNSVIHETTGFSPARIFLGRELQGPGDNAVISIPNPLFCKSSEDLDKVILQNTKQRADYNKSLYDKSRSGEQFVEGDLVLVRSFILSNAKRKRSAKLAEKWRGPYKIIRKISPITYHLQSLNNDDRVVKVAHSEQMKYYHT